MIGLVITNYERPHYLRQMLASLARTTFAAPTSIVIVDDGSVGRRTLNLLSRFQLEGARLYKIFRPRLTNFGVHECLRIGWDFLLRETECRYLANLDADAIVTPDWLTRLHDLYVEHRAAGPLAVTGFNTRNHPVRAWHADYCVKESCGGINLFFDVDLYGELVAPTLVDYGWDWAFVKAMQSRGYPILCSRPSVVQHIGVHGYHSNPDGVDRADDFPPPRRQWSFPFLGRRAG